MRSVANSGHLPLQLPTPPIFLYCSDCRDHPIHLNLIILCKNSHLAWSDINFFPDPKSKPVGNLARQFSLQCRSCIRQGKLHPHQRPDSLYIANHSLYGTRVRQLALDLDIVGTDIANSRYRLYGGLINGRLNFLISAFENIPLLTCRKSRSV